MSLLSSYLRSSAVPRLLQPTSRGLATGHVARAAAAPAPNTRYVRRAPTRAAPAKAAAPAASSAPAAASTSTPSPSSPSAPSPSFDDFDNFSISPEPMIGDYAHLSRYPASPSPSPSSSSARTVASTTAAPTPTPSPPLTALPGEGYQPLPSASDSANAGGIPGEGPVASGTDWSTSFSGLSDKPFDIEVAEALLRPLSPEDVEIKPDGLLYLPEIKYRRTLNAAFGPGGWGLAPRGETNVGPKIVSREWGLVCLGRLVAIARGEQEYFDPSGVATATEACKSNALMRCCKDLGIASELWDPRFIREFKAKHCVEAFVEHVVTKKKRKLWRKKGDKFEYPYKDGV